jgi:hypothetical protein
MNVTVNILELASDLAHNELESLFNEEDVVIYKEDEDTFVYTDQAQEVFNELYDKYYTIIENLKIR